jgi:hypothetical protein
MHWAEIKRRLGILVGGWALLLATACSGGDKNPSGSGGGGDSATYDLAALGHAGLPADTQPEDCTETRLYSGGLKVNANGTWQIKPEVHDESGDWGYEDRGGSSRTARRCRSTRRSPGRAIRARWTTRG